MLCKNKLSSFKETFIWTCCVDGETDIPSTRLQNKTQVSLLTSLDQGSGRVTEDALLRQRTTLQHTSSIATSKSTNCPNTAAHPNRTMPNQRLRAGWGLEQAWCQHVILKTWVWGQPPLTAGLSESATPTNMLPSPSSLKLWEPQSWRAEAAKFNGLFLMCGMLKQNSPFSRIRGAQMYQICQWLQVKHLKCKPVFCVSLLHP